MQSSLLVRLIEHIARQSKPLLVLTAYLFVALIGIADYLTGPEIAFSIFYVAPIVAVTLSTNRKHGLVISIVAGTTWLVADMLSKHVYSHPLIPWWNAAVRFFFFAVITNFAAALKEKYEHVEIMARTDFLTGTANRRQLLETARSRFFSPHPDSRPFTVIYLDLDDFKKMNDNLGHATGDNILQSIGEVIRQCLRKTDIVARIGGDEFIIVLPGTATEDSRGVANKINSKIGELANQKKWPLTATMGVMTFLKPPKSVDVMISNADDLMYQAKEAGKNTVKFGTWPG